MWGVEGHPPIPLVLLQPHHLQLHISKCSQLVEVLGSSILTTPQRQPPHPRVLAPDAQLCPIQAGCNPLPWSWGTPKVWGRVFGIPILLTPSW